MIFNHAGGMVMNKRGNIIREWIWPSSGKLDDPVHVRVLFSNLPFLYLDIHLFLLTLEIVIGERGLRVLNSS